MTARRSLSCLAALSLATAAVAAPTACTTFGEESTPDGGAALDASGGGDAGSPGDADADADSGGEACKPACPAPCLVDPLDESEAGWTSTVAPGSTLTFPAGRLLSSAPAAGYAYLERPITITPGGIVHLSAVASVETVATNGTSLAKLVDGATNEIAIQIDDGRVRACVRLTSEAPTARCSPPRDLPLRMPVRLTLDVTLPGSTLPASVTLRVGCSPGDQLMLPMKELLRTDQRATVHLGVEGLGTAYFDDLELRPSN